MANSTFSIPGMHCQSCAALIRDVSGEFAGITKVDVDVGSKNVVVEHADGFDLSPWIAGVEALGEAYKVVKK
ncbi:heavy-metal-associated domain-containing protein [Candidatus Peregrinibacteria bacterium]|nr:heavy-metal-associated domain-containing protein [Candidatus Peregrinibacteria bacterium]